MSFSTSCAHRICFSSFRAETDRLMDHVTTLEPHKVKDTVSINNVRRKILDLTKILAEIAKKIDVTIGKLDQQRQEILDTQASAKDIKERIDIQVLAVILNQENQKHVRV